MLFYAPISLSLRFIHFFLQKNNSIAIIILKSDIRLTSRTKLAQLILISVFLNNSTVQQ